MEITPQVPLTELASSILFEIQSGGSPSFFGVGNNSPKAITLLELLKKELPLLVYQISLSSGPRIDITLT